jgi:hypothetical protein
MRALHAVVLFGCAVSVFVHVTVATPDTDPGPTEVTVGRQAARGN